MASRLTTIRPGVPGLSARTCTPPTGRIAQFLNVNGELAGLAKMGPIKSQADTVMTLFRSPETAVHLVTVLEEMPVQETCDGIAELTGSIAQVPSSVSAIKVDGKRAYALARAGADVELAGRPVTVSRFEVLARRAARAEVAVTDLDVAVDCSSGTYIRALARDLGASLGVGGHLTALRRTRVGGFDLAGALSPDELTADPPQAPALMPLGEVARRSFAVVELTDDQARDVGYGRPLSITVPDDPTALLHQHDLLALYRPDGDRAVPVAVLA